MGRKTVAQHFAIEVQLDGVYIIRTSLGADETVAAYKSLTRVERAFRSLKTGQLEVRPAYAHNEEHMRGQVFQCLLAYYVEWHLRQRLAPPLFEGQDRETAR